MRILHLVSYPLYSGPVPGALDLALAQKALGHEVALAFDRKRGAFNDYEEPAEPRLRTAGLDPTLPLVLSTKSTPAEVLRDLLGLRRLVRSGGVDVVHTHLSHDHGLLALAGRGRAGVVRVRTFHSDRSLARRFGQAWVNRRAEGWVVRCQEHATRLLEAFHLPAARVRLIPGSVDAGRFAPAAAEARAAARRRFAIAEAARVILHAALIAGRGQEELVDAVASLGESAPQILFAGRGEREHDLRARVERCGLGARVHFAGYLQGDALLDGYAAADAAFVAQPGNDASARAALEAMACGLPVIAVRTGALAELVDARVGWAIPERRPERIAAALREWLTDGAGGRERGTAGRTRVVGERSVAQEAAATLGLYRQLLRPTPT